MIRALFKILSLMATARAASKGPAPLAKRLGRRAAHRRLARLLR